MSTLNRRQLLGALGATLLERPRKQLLTAMDGDSHGFEKPPAHSSPSTSGKVPLLTPIPRYLIWKDTPFPLDGSLLIVADQTEEQQIARILQGELRRLYHIRAQILRQVPRGKPHVLLALVSTPAGAANLRKVNDKEFRHAVENKEEAYFLEVSQQVALVVAKSARGLLYGTQTLLQLVVPNASESTKQITGAHIVDYPELPFRGLHICVFPETDLDTVRREILMASRYKYNTVVIEFWASLKSRKWPQTAYEDAYTWPQIRPLIELGRTLKLDMVPELNSGGHQSGMRASSGENVVLDRFPNLKELFGPRGWSLCLSNPKIYPFLFDRYDELLDLFGHPHLFHVGMDEAWGSRGYVPCPRCWGTKPPYKLIEAHIRKIYNFFSKRNIRILMWHDMFLWRNDPLVHDATPANSVPPINSYLALDAVPKDVIICAWNYSESRTWPVPKYFSDKGYPVLVSCWKKKSNTIMLLNTAKKQNLLGMLETTWDSPTVSLPSIGQAGVLAWTPPNFDLDQIPFDHWLKAIRELPV